QQRRPSSIDVPSASGSHRRSGARRRISASKNEKGTHAPHASVYTSAEDIRSNRAGTPLSRSFLSSAQKRETEKRRSQRRRAEREASRRNHKRRKVCASQRKSPSSANFINAREYIQRESI
ncbi:hypothetical protein IscW_ISCW018373, partial [Ixodes scapularis]